MSTDAGAAGAYGILLSTVEDIPAVAVICKQLEEIAKREDKDGDREFNEPDAVPEVTAQLGPLIQAFAEAGVIVPTGASLIWTGSEDERPARCETEAEAFVLGFGLMTRPDQYPPMPKEFLERSEWHTWVWMG
jgi:hypothetical protein